MTPSTSVYISTDSAPKATPRAAAVVSLPPRPNVVTSPFLLKMCIRDSYQTACLARKLSGVNVAVFDSWAATLGQGLQVIKAALLAEKGM